MKIYLDDMRPAPEGWIRVETASEAIGLLNTGKITHISLDHDLGEDPGVGNGYDVICFIERQVMLGLMEPPEISIHTANNTARPRMEQALANILKWKEQQ